MFRRNTQTPSTDLPVITPPFERPLSRREQRCLSWSNVALGALIPLAIGVFAVVQFLQQQKIDDRRRAQDQQIANLTRMKDIELANLTRIQDREFEDKRRDQDQQQADELHYQSVYKTYIEDISNVIFKLNSNSSFLDNRAKLAYIRGKTLPTLRELDWQRKTQLFIFLSENSLLPQIPSSQDSPSLDLSGSTFVNITLTSSKSKKYNFSRVSLSSIDLTHASFIDFEFSGGVHFNGSEMANVMFNNSVFYCTEYFNDPADLSSVPQVFFDDVKLENASFQNTQLCAASFNRANLANADFSFTFFGGKIEFRDTYLSQAKFSAPRVDCERTDITFCNSNMTGTQINLTEWFSFPGACYNLNLVNVILPNGTWLVSDRNLVRNGNGEVDCSPSTSSTLDNEITDWISSDIDPYSSPIQTYNRNFTNTTIALDNCYFSFITRNSIMFQIVDLGDFSMFSDSCEAEFRIRLDIACHHQSTFEVILQFANEKSLARDTRKFGREFNQSTLSEWQRWEETGEIPSATRSIMLALQQIDQGTCLVDNIELYIFRGSKKKKQQNGVGQMNVFGKYHSLKLKRSQRRW